MFIFRFTTYHKFFWSWVWVLIGFSAFSGWMMDYYNFGQFYLWHLGIMLLIVWGIYIKEKKVIRKFIETGQSPLGPMDKKELELSGERTKRYYILSSIIYLVVFALSFLYFFNRNF